MKLNFWLVLAMAVVFTAGCGKSDAVGVSASNPSKADDEKSASETKHAHNHSGWWCNEHGVPEEVCALCSSKVAAEFQKKGDWCKEHDRPDSQCFKCHPDLEAKFAAQYEAKYGKKPPKPES